MNKLLFDSPRGVKFQQKVLAQKAVPDALILKPCYVQFFQNRHFKFLPVDFRYYQKSVWEYLALLNNGMWAKLKKP
jgi:hypothetical protein